jgi:diacylglycerol kinase (ATP)
VERFTQASFKKEGSPVGEPSALAQSYLVICNPVSRGGNAMKEAVWLLKHLSRLGVRHEAFFTDYPGHARKIVKRWMERVDVVVAVGGDGTVNEVVNGMMDVPDQDKTFAVFPAGTADDFCHNVGIGRERVPALEVLLTDHDRRMDLIKHNDSFAAVGFGIGVDGEIAYKTLSHKRVRLPAYVAVGLRIVFKERFRNSNKRLRIDTGDTVFDEKFLIAVFGNAPLYARFVWWMPDARMDDGLIDMSALRPISPIPAWYLLMRSSNREYRSDKILRVASEEFTIELLEEAYVQVDGEVYKYKQGEVVHLSVARKALRVRVPRHDKNRVWSE